MTTPAPLTAETKKRIRNQHPLFRRISGDVVWEILAQCGYNDQQCGDQLDALLATMHIVIDVMHTLETQPDHYLAYTSTSEACPQCAMLSLTLISGQDLLWRQCLPPFSIGCSLQCAAITAQEAAQRIAHTPQLSIKSVAEITLPPNELVCPRLSLINT